MPDYDIAIVGGGWTGVHAAYRIALTDPGARILLLEASDRLGGRARSIEIAPGRALDFGAHYFGIKQRRIHALARRIAPGLVYEHPPLYGLDPGFRTFVEGSWRITTKSTSFLEIQGLSRKIPPSDMLAMFGSLARYHALEDVIDVRAPWNTPGAAELDAQSAQSFIDAQDGPAWIREMWGLGVLDILSVHAKDISLLYWLWYNRANGGFLLTANDFTGGPQEFSVLCGLGGLLEHHSKEIQAEIRLETPVVAIDHSHPDHVELALADGNTVSAECAIVAVTPAIAGRIRYEPELSPTRKRLHAQKTGHASKAIAVYRHAFWRDDPAAPLMGMTAGPGAEGIEWGLDTTQPGGSPSLSVFVSDRLLDRAGPSPDARRAAVAEALVELTGDPRAKDPIRLEVYDWRDHPYVGGGPNTSFAPGVLSQVGEAFGKPEFPHRRLFFAAAEYSTSFPGYVEGALASAAHVAAQIAWRRAGMPGDLPALPPGPEPHEKRAAVLDEGGDLLLSGHRFLRRFGL
ncbi:FAD-dependent oxidoreductase [Polyangium jinanense]|uniref:flavin monoamine oxidase family protein n=1 Tax=Polyangium jinanense TaxID=2829994 RepID=UPI0023426F0B|nr:FAD-dependent oxidoreductase [Polyangium jinanense]MDC3958446.1 FAD-dependent oxidoreductase [Polyangium jinanense]